MKLPISESGPNIASEMMDIIKRYDIPTNWIFGSFPIYARRVNIIQYLACYELFSLSKEVPGSIVECGVFQGKSLFSFATFLEIFSPTDTLKKVLGFDNFSGFKSFHEKDGPVDGARSKKIGGWSPQEFKEAFDEILALRKHDQVMTHHDRVEIIDGDVCKTVPEYVAKNPGLRISLLNLDVDLYEPTIVALEHLYPLISPGGVVVLDEYALTEWAGESAAFDDYFQGKRPKIKKFPWANTPGGYFIKEE